MQNTAKHDGRDCAGDNQACPIKHMHTSPHTPHLTPPPPGAKKTTRAPLRFCENEQANGRPNKAPSLHDVVKHVRTLHEVFWKVGRIAQIPLKSPPLKKKKKKKNRGVFMTDLKNDVIKCTREGRITSNSRSAGCERNLRETRRPATRCGGRGWAGCSRQPRAPAGPPGTATWQAQASPRLAHSPAGTLGRARPPFHRRESAPAPPDRLIWQCAPSPAPPPSQSETKQQQRME